MSAEFPFFGHLIDNEEVESLDGARFDTVNPWTREKWRLRAAPTPTVRSPRPGGPSTRARGPGWVGTTAPR